MAELCERAGHLGRVRAAARGLQPARTPHRGRRAALPRERGRHRARVRPDRAPRDRRTPPPRVPDGSRAPVGAARAGRRAGAALSQRRAARGGARGPRERSPASRRSSRSSSSRATSRRWPNDDRARPGDLHPRRTGLPERGHPLQGRDAAARRPGGVPRVDRPARGVGRPASARRDPRRRGARLHLRRRPRLRARLRLRDRPEARQAALEDRGGDATTSSTARTRSRCTSTRSSPARA